MKITAQDIKDIGFSFEMFSAIVKQADSEVIVSALNYTCIAPHVSSDENKPGTGASWQTYWSQAGFRGVAWVTATDYTAPFKALIDIAIAEQSAALLERIGSAAYNLAANDTYVKKAEKNLVAAAMVQRRINIVLNNVHGAGKEFSTKSERDQRQDYLDEAEIWITKLAQGVTTDASSDFACTTITNSRFAT